LDASIASTSVPLMTRVIEHRHRVEDRMLVVAQEARHCDPVEDDGGGGALVGRVPEAVGRRAGERNAAAIERGEQRFEPERVLVENGKIGHHAPDTHCARACKPKQNYAACNIVSRGR
jgi:hypothetical protein